MKKLIIDILILMLMFIPIIAVGIFWGIEADKIGW